MPARIGTFGFACRHTNPLKGKTKIANFPAHYNDREK